MTTQCLDMQWMSDADQASTDQCSRQEKQSDVRQRGGPVPIVVSLRGTPWPIECLSNELSQPTRTICQVTASMSAPWVLGQDPPDRSLSTPRQTWSLLGARPRRHNDRLPPGAPGTPHVEQCSASDERPSATGGTAMGQPAQQQDVPGLQSKMDPVPDCGETSYRGSGKLQDKVAVITGARQRHRTCRGHRLRPGGRGRGDLVPVRGLGRRGDRRPGPRPPAGAPSWCPVTCLTRTTAAASWTVRCANWGASTSW